MHKLIGLLHTLHAYYLGTVSTKVVYVYPETKDEELLNCRKSIVSD